MNRFVQWREQEDEDCAVEDRGRNDQPSADRSAEQYRGHEQGGTVGRGMGETPRIGAGVELPEPGAIDALMAIYGFVHPPIVARQRRDRPRSRATVWGIVRR